MRAAGDALLARTIAVRAQAYAPYSQFLVGAGVRLSDGSTHVGCNVENASYGLSICAERNAVYAAVASGKLGGGAQRIVQVAVVASSPMLTAPCGACRQVLLEFAAPEATALLHNLRDACSQQMPLVALLPHAFGPAALAAAPTP